MRYKSLGQQKFYSLLLVSSVEMLLSVLALLADTIIAGHSVGEDGIAAMNVITPIVSFAVFIGTLLKDIITLAILTCHFLRKSNSLNPHIQTSSSLQISAVNFFLLLQWR